MKRTLTPRGKEMLPLNISVYCIQQISAIWRNTMCDQGKSSPPPYILCHALAEYSWHDINALKDYLDLGWSWEDGALQLIWQTVQVSLLSLSALFSSWDLSRQISTYYSQRKVNEHHPTLWILRRSDTYISRRVLAYAVTVCLEGKRNNPSGNNRR